MFLDYSSHFKILFHTSILWSLTRIFVQSLTVVWFRRSGLCFGPLVLSHRSLSFHCVYSTHSRTTGAKEGIMPKPTLTPAPCPQYHWEPVQLTWDPSHLRRGKKRGCSNLGLNAK